MDDENPFRSPLSNTALRPEPSERPSAGLWRDGALLVLRKDALLPDRCIACNAPAEDRRWRHKFYWHPPVYCVVILLNPLIYAILAMFLLTSAQFELGICARHERQRRRRVTSGLLVAFIGLLGIVASVVCREPGAPLIASVCILLSGLTAAIIGRRLVRSKRIGNYFVWIKGVHPGFMAEYPDWLGRLSPYTKRRMLPPPRFKARRPRKAVESQGR